MIRSFACLPASLLLACVLTACGAEQDAPGAGGMTVGENARLEAAADRLDGRAQSPAQPAASALEAEVAAGIAAEQAAEQPAGERRQ